MKGLQKILLGISLFAVNSSFSQVSTNENSKQEILDIRSKIYNMGSDTSYLLNKEYNNGLAFPSTISKDGHTEHDYEGFQAMGTEYVPAPTYPLDSILKMSFEDFENQSSRFKNLYEQFHISNLSTLNKSTIDLLSCYGIVIFVETRDEIFSILSHVDVHSMKEDNSLSRLQDSIQIKLKSMESEILNTKTYVVGGNYDLKKDERMAFKNTIETIDSFIIETTNNPPIYTGINLISCCVGENFIPTSKVYVDTENKNISIVQPLQDKLSLKKSYLKDELFEATNIFNIEFVDEYCEGDDVCIQNLKKLIKLK